MTISLLVTLIYNLANNSNKYTTYANEQNLYNNIPLRL